MTGGGALGDLPAHAPRLSTASEATTRRKSFLITHPLFVSTGKNLHVVSANFLVQKSHTHGLI
jgi:hypothetical protein